MSVMKILWLCYFFIFVIFYIWFELVVIDCLFSWNWRQSIYTFGQWSGFVLFESVDWGDIAVETLTWIPFIPVSILPGYYRTFVFQKVVTKTVIFELAVVLCPVFIVQIVFIFFFWAQIYTWLILKVFRIIYINFLVKEI